MTGKKGTRYENGVAGEIDSRTDDTIQSWPVKDRVASDAPDIVVVAPSGVVGLELKDYSDDFGIAESELIQLLNTSKSYFDVGILVNFPYRRPVVVEPVFNDFDAFAVDDQIDPIENFKQNVPDAFNPRRTDGGDEPTLRLSKPDTDEWPSSNGPKEEEGADVVIEHFLD